MSAFLSAIHYQVFQKMRNQEEQNEKLHALLQSKSTLYKPYTKALPDGNLEDVIDLDQIHAWLHEHIIQLNIHMSNILEELKLAGMLEDAKQLCYEDGKAVAHKDYASCKEVFQHLQSLALTGMPCDRGTILLNQDDASLCFQINLDVFQDILDKENFIELRFAWMQGLLHDTLFLIEITKPCTFTIKQGDSACTI